MTERNVEAVLQRVWTAFRRSMSLLTIIIDMSDESILLLVEGDKSGECQE